MSDIIRLLPDSLANQIAAGEVVQRPASAIKELLENAIDAGASNISVIIKDAGKALMQVIDNGKGMSETDARMSLERHATSKITKSEDLFSINTMGFRGEALASIAAVSQLEIKSRQANDDLGTMILVEGSEVKKQEPVTCKPGTSICIKNLFYNVPARRNFLKSNGVETKHIIEEFVRVALAHPQVAFALYQNDLETYNLPSGKLSQRIVNIFGKNYREQLAACDEQTDQIVVRGYIGKPEYAKRTRGEQYFFVNNRFIKSPYLNHAITNAFEGLIQEGSFPFYVLFIEIDPRHIDVNVHPTKTEVKFDDERTIYAIVRAAVKQALATHNLIPTIDFDADINLGQKLQVQRETIKEKNYSQFKTATPQEKSNLENWERLFDENKGKGSVERDILETPEESTEAITFTSAVNSPEESEQLIEHSIFQLHNKYLITQVKSGMMIVDQQAAHERVLYEKYIKHLDRKNGASQQSLFPQSVSLNPGDFSLVMEMEEELKALGFLIERFGKSDILVKGMPGDIAASNEQHVFEGIIEQFKKNKSELSIDRRENLARSLAKRTAVKHGGRLGQEEMSGLIDQLFACENPNYAPNGGGTFYILEEKKIENYFNR